MNNLLFIVALLCRIGICSATFYDDIPVNNETSDADTIDPRSLEGNMNVFASSRSITKTSANKNERIHSGDVNDRQKKVWEVIDTMDSYKFNRIYSQSGSRPTLSTFHYVIQPVWWRDQVENDPIDRNAIDDAMAQAVQYYSDMSFGKMVITYEILDQTVLKVSSASPTFIWTKKQCEKHLTSSGYRKGVDFDGVILIYPIPQGGDLKHSGGHGLTNGDFIWISTTSLLYKVFRHEIGHNFGHDHHGRNTYWYRTTRPGSSGVTDGFDMMGGGNKYAISDFNLASKWFYNWVEDSSIVKMQPEGPTPECPLCVSSGTFTLKALDMRNTSPQSTDLFGVHIPITTTYDTHYGTDYVHSYWISYRSGADGLAAGGVSIHHVWWELYGDFGGYFYGMMYDTSGHTESKLDSFLGDGSCYHVSPSAYMKDRDSDAVEAVRPIVCVEGINEGIDITVSVSFLDIQNLSPPKIDFVEHPTITCSNVGSQVSKTVATSSYNLLHVKSSGSTSKLSVAMNGGSTAYFYDEFPYSPIYLGSAEGYGSFAYLNGGSSMDYDSAYDDIWILVPPSNNGGNSVTLSMQCETKPECVLNHYLQNGVCQQCPSNSIAEFGATSINDCNQCPAGTLLSNPSSSECTLSQDYIEISPSRGWRIWAPYFHSDSWAWAISNLSFFSDVNCASPISPLGTPIDSANAGAAYGPENAFGLGMNENWGGRMDSDGALWIGMMFDNLTNVKCLKLTSFRHHVNEIRVQAFDETEGIWKNAWIQQLDVSTYRSTNTVKLNYGGTIDTPEPTSSPTTSPTASPTSTPTSTPTSKPTKSPIMIPTGSPVSDPVATPTLNPTRNPVKDPTNSPIKNPTTQTVPCEENDWTKYLFKVKTNGKPVGRTCASLAKKTEKAIKRICNTAVATNTKFAPATIACPVTCGCSEGNEEENSEETTCTQNDGDIFLLKKGFSNGAAFPVKRSCQWLDGRPNKAISRICGLSTKFRGIQPANKVCFRTCNSCQ